jgi:hypothetical protein
MSRRKIGDTVRTDSAFVVLWDNAAFVSSRLQAAEHSTKRGCALFYYGKSRGRNADEGFLLSVQVAPWYSKEELQCYF